MNEYQGRRRVSINFVKYFLSNVLLFCVPILWGKVFSSAHAQVEPRRVADVLRVLQPLGAVLLTRRASRELGKYTGPTNEELFDCVLPCLSDSERPYWDSCETVLTTSTPLNFCRCSSPSKRVSKERGSKPEAAYDSMGTTMKEDDRQPEISSAMHKPICTKTAASGGSCRDLPRRTPQRGCGKPELASKGIHSISNCLRQPPPAAPAKDGFGVEGQRGLLR